jgi:hypothetical protein
VEQGSPSYDLLAFELIRLIDQGRSESIAEVRRRIDTGSLLDHLAERGAHLSACGTLDRAAIMERFASIAGATDPDVDFDITRNGLALCLAYCVQAMAPDRSAAFS